MEEHSPTILAVDKLQSFMAFGVANFWLILARQRRLAAHHNGLDAMEIQLNCQFFSCLLGKRKFNIICQHFWHLKNLNLIMLLKTLLSFRKISPVCWPNLSLVQFCVFSRLLTRVLRVIDLLGAAGLVKWRQEPHFSSLTTFTSLNHWKLLTLCNFFVATVNYVRVFANTSDHHPLTPTSKTPTTHWKVDKQVCCALHFLHSTDISSAQI